MMLPIDPPSLEETPEGLTRWVRQFTETFNTLLDMLSGSIRKPEDLQQAEPEAQDTALKQALLAAHPVGCYYWSSKATDPGALFGGSWERVTGRFLYAADDAHAAGTTGGEAEHTLSIAEMPRHAHKVRYVGGNANGVHGGQPGTSVNADAAYNELILDYEGGGQAHNNLPPFIAAYCWRRIA